MENFKKLTMYDESQTTIATTETIPFQRVEEREIIGYEAPFDMDAWKVKAGTEFKLFDKGLYRSEGIGIKVFLPAEWVETWKPVYREKPVFKVGDWIKRDGYDLVIQIQEVHVGSRRYSSKIDLGVYCIDFSQAIAATPEEIEAARPKRKYMQQIWYVTEYDDDFGTMRVERFISNRFASEWVLENSIDNRIYKIEQFEVVAYE